MITSIFWKLNIFIKLFVLDDENGKIVSLYDYNVKKFDNF